MAISLKSGKNFLSSYEEEQENSCFVLGEEYLLPTPTSSGIRNIGSNNRDNISIVCLPSTHLTEVLLENCVLVHHPRHFNPPAVKTETSGVIVNQVTYRFFPATCLRKQV